MRSPKKVLFLITQAHWGGAQSFLVRFAVQLQKDGFDVLIASGGEGGLWNEAKKAGISTRALQSLKRSINPIDDFFAYREIKNLIKEYNPDFIHLNSTKMGLFGSFAARSFGIPVVYRIGGWRFLDPLPGFLRIFYTYLERITASLKNFIVVVHPGDLLIAQEKKIQPKQKIIAIPNGIAVQSFQKELLSSQDARRKLGIPEDAFVFGSVSNAYKTKGLDWYLKEMNVFLKGKEDVHVVVIGDGPQFSELTKIHSSLDRKIYIHLIGHQSNAAHLYKGFDVFVLPSRKEGMSTALLEAMAAGVPSIVTDVGANRWVIENKKGNAGFCISFGDGYQLRESMSVLLSDKNRRNKMGNIAEMSVKERFSWEKTYQAHKAVLDQLR